MPLSEESKVRCHFAARTIARSVTLGKSSDWLLSLGFPLREGAFPTDAALLLNEKWLARAMLIRWPMNRIGDFNTYSTSSLLRRHTAEEQMEICSILENWYGFYA